MRTGLLLTRSSAETSLVASCGYWKIEKEALQAMYLNGVYSYGVPGMAKETRIEHLIQNSLGEERKRSLHPTKHLIVRLKRQKVVAWQAPLRGEGACGLLGGLACFALCRNVGRNFRMPMA